MPDELLERGSSIQFTELMAWFHIQNEDMEAERKKSEARSNLRGSRGR